MNQVQTFWHNFLHLLPQFTEGDEPSQSAMESLLTSLQMIDDRLYFFIGSTDEGMDLILSAEGYPDLMPVIADMKAAAPAMPGWHIVVSYEADLLFGQRNMRVFPDTDNGNVLYMMGCKGDALWISRAVNFSVVFPGMQAAEAFAVKLREDGYSCEASLYDGAERFHAQAEVTLPLIPTCDNIGKAEDMLAALALPFGGQNDGWGCFEVSAEEANLALQKITDSY